MSIDYTIAFVRDKYPTADYFCAREFDKSIEGENILGLGTGGKSEFDGLSDRPRIFYNAIKNGLIKTKYIFAIDCFDLVFVDKPEVILEKHFLLNCDISIGAEKNCFPDLLKEQFDELAPKNTSYKYLNCGTIIAETEALLAMYESMDALNKPRDFFDVEKGGMHHYNEQGWYMDEYLKQPVKIALDYNQNICNCLQNVKPEELDFSEQRIRNIECNTYPSIWHMNGSSKTDFGVRELILKHLGY